jgi:hypothetical protein
MKIATYKDYSNIKELCLEYGIKDYTINKDLTIDVDGDVNLRNLNITEIPLNFNKVMGKFCIVNTKIKSLKGCPKYIGSDFELFFCKDLESFEHGPTYVGGNIDAFSTGIKSLKGLLDVINNLDLSSSRLTSLKNSPKIINGHFDVSSNKLDSFEGIENTIFNGVYLDLRFNNISSFDFFPIIDNKRVHLESNPIETIWDLFKDLSKIELFNDYDPIRIIDGNRYIILDRLNSFLEDVGKEPVSEVKGYETFNNQ